MERGSRNENCGSKTLCLNKVLKKNGIEQYWQKNKGV